MAAYPTESERGIGVEAIDLERESAAQELVKRSYVFCDMAANDIRNGAIARATYEPGEVIGARYRVHRVLGRGAFGIVYLVRSVEDGTIYALKSILAEHIFEEAVTRLFEKEALIWVRLGWSPFIVQAHHVQYLDNRLFVAMEYVPPDEAGLVSVYDHIAYHANRIGDGRTGLWSIQFCHGMEHAVGHGVTAHRDIKPMNLLVDQAAILKVSDFGLVASMDASRAEFKGLRDPGHGHTILRTDGKRACGTPGFIAPEVLRGDGAGLRSDIFSFGVTLWQLTAGSTQLPYSVQFKGDVDAFTKELYEQQLRGRITPVRSIFWPTITRCLEPDPSRRFANYAELRDSIKSAMKAANVAVVDFIVNKDRKSASDFVNRGASLRSLGLLEDALRCYDEALLLEPNNTAALVNKGNVLSEMHRGSEAIAAFDTALRIDPKYEGAWLNRAVCLQKDGQYERSIRSLDSLLEVNPDHVRAIRTKALAYRRCGRGAEAMPLYEKALRLRPEDADTWTARGETFSELGQADDALICYDEAIALRPDYRLPRINKARQLVVAGRKAEGVREFSELAAAFVGQSAALNEIAIGLCAVNLQEQAIPLFSEVLRLSPSEAAVSLCNIGNALLEMNREIEALEWYRQSIDVDPKYLSPYVQSAKAHHRIGNLKQCVDWYEKALEVDARDAKCWFGRGSTLLEMGENLRAIECFDNALKVQPFHKQVLYNKAVALLQFDRPDEALFCLVEALRVDSRYAAAWYLKAYVEKATGQKDAAIDSCRAYLGLTGQLEKQRADAEKWLSELSG